MMKFSVTLFCLFLFFQSWSQIPKEGYSKLELNQEDQIHSWYVQGCQSHFDTVLIQINYLSIGSKETSDVRKVFEIKYVLNLGAKMELYFTRPTQGLTQHIVDPVCQVKVDGEDLFALFTEESKYRRIGKAEKTHLTFIQEPLESWQGEGENFQNSSINIYYKKTTEPASYLDVRNWQDSRSVYVQWTTAEEKNVDYYKLERMDEFGNYTVIDSVPAANTGARTHYVAIDRKPNSTNEYRIVGTDTEMNKFSSESFTVLAEKPSAIVQTNSVQSSGELKVYISQLNVKQEVNVRIVDAKGLAVYEEATEDDQLNIDVSALKPGIYSVYANNEFVKRFVKN